MSYAEEALSRVLDGRKRDMEQERESEGMIKARVMVQHYISAQQMNNDLQTLVRELQEKLQRCEARIPSSSEVGHVQPQQPPPPPGRADFARLEESEAHVKRLEAEVQSYKTQASLTARLADQATVLQDKVGKLEEENARLRNMEVESGSLTALHVQNQALRIKLKEKKQHIASLEQMLRLQLSLRKG